MTQAIHSGQVLTVLRSGPLREPAHAWLYEVRGSTGFNRTTRYADGIVVSLWPSRGLWIAGVEVKVSRGDWKRELDNPRKAAEIQRFCHYWWIAAPEGVVEPSEVPETWGLYLVRGKKAKLAKKAPRLQPEPLTIDFVASVLRNQAESVTRIRQEGYHEGFGVASEKFDRTKYDALSEKLHQAEVECNRAKQQLLYHERDLTNLKHTIAQFETVSGVKLDLHTYRDGSWRQDNIGKQFKAARLLAEMNATVLGERFLEVGRALQAVAELTTEKTEP